MIHYWQIGKRFRIKYTTAIGLLAIVIPILIYIPVRWYQNNKAELPYFSHETQAKYGEEAIHYVVSDFSFRDQNNQVITKSFTKDKICIANYFFTSCATSCIPLMKHMGTIADNFKNNAHVKLLSFTVDPERDSSQRLLNYANKRNIQALQWKLLTGAKPELYRYARKSLYIVATDGDGGPEDFLHSNKMVLIDQRGHIRGYYDGTDEAETQQIIKDIHKLL